MKCEKCHINEATVFLTQTQNGKTTEMHLCDSCAKESESLLFNDGVAFQQFLSSLLDSSPSTQNKNQMVTCENCGMTLDRFKKSSLVGCSNCYAAFSLYLQPIIKRIQSGSTHTGKAPKQLGTNKKAKERIQRLERELKLALMQENYEQAAFLRDEIRALKEEEAI